MKLILKNFAKIKEAEIHFDGLTVIAGDNNTGKSTIGKVLFTLFHLLRNMPQQVLEERKEVIKTFFNVIFRQNVERYRLFRPMEKYGMSALFRGIDLTDNLQDMWSKIFLHNIKQELGIDLSNEEKQELKSCIDNAWAASDNELEISLTRNAFSDMFVGQVNSLYDDEDAHISLHVQGKAKVARFRLNECTYYENGIELYEDAVYVDDPFLIEQCFNPPRGSGVGRSNNPMRNGLIRYLELDKRPGVIESLEIRRKLSEILSLFQPVMPGNIVRNRQRFTLQAEGQDQPLNVENWSAGMKSFAILKRLFENGTLHEKGVLILDEPEIHLHPEWQLRYAEILVLLQKKFDLTVLLTTHSPFFLDAIELYACKHGIGDKAHYYLSEAVGNQVSFRDVSNEIDKIYEKMSASVQTLENLRAELRMRR